MRPDFFAPYAAFQAPQSERDPLQLKIIVGLLTCTFGNADSVPADTAQPSQGYTPMTGSLHEQHPPALTATGDVYRTPTGFPNCRACSHETVLTGNTMNIYFSVRYFLYDSYIMRPYFGDTIPGPGRPLNRQRQAFHKVSPFVKRELRHESSLRISVYARDRQLSTGKGNEKQKKSYEK